LSQAAIPSNESDRLQALIQLKILDTPPEERFNRITRLTASLFGCKYASISFIDTHRQWFKSLANLTLTETSRETAFCAHTIVSDNILEVKDTHLDPRFSDNPFVIGEPKIRFYAGIKIMFNGYAVGSLCVLDPQPKQLTEEQRLSLQDLGKMVEAELQHQELSRLSLALEETQKLARVRSHILEKVVNAESLPLVLNSIVEAIEAEYTNQRCSILLLENNHLRLGAAPSLPQFYNDAIDGVEIGVGQGSCGTTAFTNKVTIVEDINTHPYWAAWKTMAEKAHLGACWSAPIHGANGKVLGTFAVYHDKPAVPSQDELTRITLFAHIASIAIERERTNELIWRQANYDELTALPNRHLLEEHLKRAQQLADGTDTKLAVLLLDLDNFKDINDTLGHGVGDDLLIECARRIERCIKQNDTLARLGGDEFVLVINNVNHSNNLERIIQNILTTIAKPYCIQQERIHTSASIGVTIYPDDAKDVTSLLKNADQAMYGAKAMGKNSHHYFTKKMHKKIMQRLLLLNDLRYAIENKELFIQYQPIVNILDQSITKAEALIRWQHPTKGLIRPDDFIPIAEESGLIIEISNWVFTQVCDDVRKWRKELCADLQISINTSPSHYLSADPHILSWLQQLLETETPTSAILLEVTENLLMNADESVAEKLFHFRQAGVSIALDDFGTGYSSISYLKKYPTDYLKIDRSFVNSMTEVSNDKILCEAIIVMAKKLGIKVVAEGIETKEQLNILKTMGCDYGQGYLFAKPLDKAAFAALLLKQKQHLLDKI
jgi:diguanylate cyclase (GGDEF)-like protein